jgi:hypothetical protein
MVFRSPFEADEKLIAVRILDSQDVVPPPRCLRRNGLLDGFLKQFSDALS